MWSSHFSSLSTASSSVVFPVGKKQEKYKWSQKNYSSLMVIANNDEDLGGGGNSPDVLVVTTFHFLLAKDFYHKSDVFLSIVIGKTLYSYTK